MPSRRMAVCLEVTPKQTVASALDWPGWCRAGRDEGAALEALASYAERYAPVAKQAAVSFPSTVDFDALAAAPTRIVIAVGEESMGTVTGRTSMATAELLGQQATVFPSHHGGFMGGESGYPGQPEAFARKLREVLNLNK